MGNCAELCAKEKGISRAEQDAFAAETYRRALRAQAEGKFTRRDRPGRDRRSARAPPTVVADDEEPGRGDIEKLGALRPAFQKDGTVTAGNASSINDGAAALVLAGADAAAARGWKPLARIVARGGARAGAGVVHDRAGGRDRTACSTRAGWKKDDVDLWEINEAFAVVSIANNQLLGLDPGAGQRLGRRGRARSPDRRVGRARAGDAAVGAARRGQAPGVASLCIGGGEGIALAVELDLTPDCARRCRASRDPLDGITRIGVVGAGQMGRGIAQVAARTASRSRWSTRSATSPSAGAPRSASSWRSWSTRRS